MTPQHEPESRYYTQERHSRAYRFPSPPTGLELLWMTLFTTAAGFGISLLLTPVISGNARPYVAAALSVILVVLVRYSPYLFRRVRLVFLRRRLHHGISQSSRHHA